MEEARIILTSLNGILMFGISIYAGYITWRVRFCKNFLAIAVMVLLFFISVYFLFTSLAAFNYVMGLNAKAFSVTAGDISQASLSITCLRILISFFLFEAMRGLYTAIRKAEES